MGKTFKDRRNWERKSDREPKDTVNKAKRNRHRDIDMEVAIDADDELDSYYIDDNEY